MSMYYLIRKGGQPEGPIDTAQVYRLIASGEIGPDDHLSKTLAGPWLSIGRIPKLAAVIPHAKGPAPSTPSSRDVPAVASDGGGDHAHGTPLGADPQGGWGPPAGGGPQAGGGGPAVGGGPQAGGGGFAIGGGPQAGGWGPPAGGGPQAGGGGPRGGGGGGGWGPPAGGGPQAGGWGPSSGGGGGGWGPPAGGGPQAGGWGPGGGGGSGWGPAAGGPTQNIWNEPQSDESPLLAPARMAEAVLGRLNAIAASGLFERLSLPAEKFGHIGLLVGGAAAMTYAIVFAIRLDSLRIALVALAIPILVAIVQFGDWKFLDLCSTVVKNTVTKTSSLALYQFTALLLIVAAAAVVAGGAYTMIQLGGTEGRYTFVGAVALGSVLAISGWMFLTPAALNLIVDESCSAGEDGLGLIGTLLKANLASIRLLFGVLCFVGGGVAAVGAIWFAAETDPRAVAWFGTGTALLAYGALIPILLYIISIIYYIIPDLMIGVIRHTKQKA